MYAFKDNKFLKADARESLLGNLTVPVISIFIYTLISVMLSDLISNFGSSSVALSIIFSALVFLVVNTCTGMLRIGLSCIFLRLQFVQHSCGHKRLSLRPGVSVHASGHPFSFILIWERLSRASIPVCYSGGGGISGRCCNPHTIRDLHLSVP